MTETTGRHQQPEGQYTFAVQLATEYGTEYGDDAELYLYLDELLRP